LNKHDIKIQKLSIQTLIGFFLSVLAPFYCSLFTLGLVVILMHCSQAISKFLYRSHPYLPLLYRFQEFHLLHFSLWEGPLVCNSILMSPFLPVDPGEFELSLTLTMMLHFSRCIDILESRILILRCIILTMTLPLLMCLMALEWLDWRIL
jgi:hypothetical protein